MVFTELIFCAFKLHVHPYLAEIWSSFVPILRLYSEELSRDLQ